MSLVSYEQAKERLRASDNEAGDLMTMIDEASNIVLDYLKKSESDFTSGIPAPVQTATLLVVGEIMKERESGSNPLSQGVMDILAPYRDPSMA